MQHYGGAKQGDRTMLDALLPAAATLEGKLQKGAFHTATQIKRQSRGLTKGISIGRTC